MKRFGPITERELDIAETTFRWALRATASTQRATGASADTVGRVLMADDELRDRLRHALEIDEEV